MIDNEIPITIYIGQALYFLATLGFIVAASILLHKRKSAATILIFIGSVLSLFSYFGSFAVNYFAGQAGVENLVAAQGWISVTGALINIMTVTGLIWFSALIKKNS